MTARNLPFFKVKLRDISRELYFENDWKMPRGLMNSREADPRNFTLAEWHQAKRMGFDARDLKAMMQECWAVSDSPSAFAQALKARGFTLAKGDRRGHVAVSPDGEIFSVARMVGKKTKEIRARLGDPDLLPDVAQAKAELAKDLSATFHRHMREAELEKLRALAPLESRRLRMAAQHRQERTDLRAKQQDRWKEEMTKRQSRYRSGVGGIWDRLTGRHAQLRKRNEREAYQGLARDRAQRQALIDAQMSDRQALQAQIKAVRDRHAGMLRELRADRKQVRQMSRQPEPAKDFVKEAKHPSTIQQRLERARAGKSRDAGRRRDLDRGR